jgi:hypothetical protein
MVSELNLTVIFGHRISKRYQGELQTEIEDLHLGNPVIRSYYQNRFAKHYVRDHDLLRIEAATNNVKDYNINKAVEHLVPLRDKMQGQHHPLPGSAAGHPGKVSRSRANCKVLASPPSWPMASRFPDSN